MNNIPLKPTLPKQYENLLLITVEQLSGATLNDKFITALELAVEDINMNQASSDRLINILRKQESPAGNWSKFDVTINSDLSKKIELLQNKTTLKTRKRNGIECFLHFLLLKSKIKKSDDAIIIL